MTAISPQSTRMELRLAFARLVLVRADDSGEYLSEAYRWVTAHHPDLARYAAFANMNALRIFLHRHKAKYPATEGDEFSALFLDAARIDERDVRQIAHVTSRTDAERAHRTLVKGENASCVDRLVDAIKADATDRTLRKVLASYVILLSDAYRA